MRENVKYIIVGSIIGASIVIGAFIMKPERSAFNDCYYENKKWLISDLNKIPAYASSDAIDSCRD